MIENPLKQTKATDVLMSDNVTSVQDFIDDHIAIIKVKTVTVPSITITASGYASFDNEYRPVTYCPLGYTHLFSTIHDYASISSRTAISLLSTGVTVCGTANDIITNLKVNHYYIKSDMVDTI